MIVRGKLKALESSSFDTNREINTHKNMISEIEYEKELVKKNLKSAQHENENLKKSLEDLDNLRNQLSLLRKEN